MLYQLPTGRVVHLTVEQYLDMTDADIDQMVRTGAGDFISSPFHGSAIKTPKKRDSEDIDKEIDYEHEDDEKHHGGGSDTCAEEESEFPDVPEDMIGD